VDQIVVNKAELIKIMEKNRENHAKIVEEAQAGFRAKVIERLDEMLKIAKTGKRPDINVGLVMPVDMTESYDRAIGMLKLDINETVNLDEHEYNQYVLDNWSWSRQSLVSNAFYSSTAAASL
jgi:hypothetical protein